MRPRETQAPQASASPSPARVWPEGEQQHSRSMEVYRTEYRTDGARDPEASSWPPAAPSASPSPLGPAWGVIWPDSRAREEKEEGKQWNVQRGPIPQSLLAPCFFRGILPSLLGGPSLGGTLLTRSWSHGHSHSHMGTTGVPGGGKGKRV